MIIKSPPCTILLKNGTQFTADDLKETETGIIVFWWDGYQMVEAHIKEGENPGFFRSMK